MECHITCGCSAATADRRRTAAALAAYPFGRATTLPLIEAFPRVRLTRARSVIEADHLICRGEVAHPDMAHALIAEHMGPAFPRRDRSYLGCRPSSER